MIDYIGHAFRTVTCFYQLPFSAEWDRRLNEIIEGGDIVGCDSHTIDFCYCGNVISVWIENRWYAFGEEYRVNGGIVPYSMRFRPTFKAMKKLWNAYINYKYYMGVEYYKSLDKRKVDKYSIRGNSE
ncbi:hypothetical protein ACNJKD_01755 [Edwardsiella tarda]|uniref:hypothetical protein n=1 Tax=Edwardsiella tarda TaxID=636 RepID=UPI003A8ADDBA